MDKLKDHMLSILQILKCYEAPKTDVLVVFLVLREVIRRLEHYLLSEKSWDPDQLWTDSFSSFINSTSINLFAKEKSVFIDVAYQGGHTIRHELHRSSAYDLEVKNHEQMTLEVKQKNDTEGKSACDAAKCQEQSMSEQFLSSNHPGNFKENTENSQIDTLCDQDLELPPSLPQVTENQMSAAVNNDLDCAQGKVVPNDIEVHVPVIFINETNNPGCDDDDISKRTCGVCDRTFHNRSNLKVHMRTHQGKTPYTCTYCDARFTTRANKVRHESTRHLGEKKHECDVCGKLFTEKKGMVIHKKTVHQGERPFQCGACGAWFTQRGALMTHRKRHCAHAHVQETNAASDHHKIQPSSQNLAGTVVNQIENITDLDSCQKNSQNMHRIFSNSMNPAKILIKEPIKIVRVVNHNGEEIPLNCI